LIGLLPEELAVRFAEAHQNAPIAGFLGVAHRFIVGADINLPSGHYGIAIALGAKLRDPFDILLRLDIPGSGDAFHGGKHVAIWSAAPHRPVAAARIRSV